MMLHSLRQWDELEAATGEKLKQETGYLCVSDKPQEDSFLTPMAELYKRRNMKHDWLSPEQVAHRFPQFRLASNERALYNKDCGVLFASKCVEACWKVVEQLKGGIIVGERVIRLEKGTGNYLVRTEKGTLIRAKAVVFAPGAWLTSVAKEFFDLDIPTTVTAETVSYYAPRNSNVDHSMFKMPTYTVDKDNGIGIFGYYGLPMIDVPGIKLSAHYGGFVIEDINQRPKAAGGSQCHADLEEQAEKRYRKIIEANNALSAHLFPHVEDEPFKSETCLYSSTYDHDFVIDTVPDWKGVVLLGGGSGHGFKLAPAVGEAAASLVIGEDPPYDLSRFSLSRASMYDKSMAAKVK